MIIASAQGLSSSAGHHVHAPRIRLTPAPLFYNELPQQELLLLDQRIALSDAIGVVAAQCAQRVLLAGDSAGGGLTLASLLRQREQGRPLPQGVYLISPWTDLTGSGDSIKSRAAADPMLKPDWLTTGAQLYLEDTPADTPEASPLFADLAGLPPMFIQTGDDEILRDDSIRFAQKLEQAGVPVHCEIWTALWHDFPLFAPLLPEADLALERLTNWAEPILSGR